MRPVVRVRALSPRAHLPERATEGAAGFDLRAALDADLVIEPGARAVVPTGLALALPPGTEGQIRPRSGLALRHGVTVLNAPGTIDEDYRGELRVLLVNLGDAPYRVEPGARIAQLVVARYEVPDFKLVSADDFEATARGGGGFGSTGTR